MGRVVKVNPRVRLVEGRFNRKTVTQEVTVAEGKRELVVLRF